LVLEFLLHLLSFLISFLFLWEKSFSRDHSSFFGSGETEKKLSFELSQLMAQLASKELELDSERQGHQNSERALCAQVIEAEQWRDEAMTALRESSGKSKGLKKECEDILSSYALFPFISFISVLHLSDFL
jgi:tRNA(Met) C34 N-acetyltransferase TmcA